jgi:hypothetical protein
VLRELYAMRLARATSHRALAARVPLLAVGARCGPLTASGGR